MAEKPALENGEVFNDLVLRDLCFIQQEVKQRCQGLTEI